MITRWITKELSRLKHLEIPATTVDKPIVEYEFSLKYLSTTKLKNNPDVILEEPPPPLQTEQYIDNQAGGDIASNVIELPPTAIDTADASIKVLSDSNLTSIRSAFIKIDNEKMTSKPAK